MPATPSPVPAPTDAAALGVPLLEVRDLAVAHRSMLGDTPILRGVSLSIGPGEILGVVGESGAGKSMIGTAITGLLDPPLAMTGGEIVYGGRRIDTLGPDQRRALRGAEIATIFQDPMTSLNPVFTVERQLVETLGLHRGLAGRAARDEAVALLGRVGIPAPAERLRSYPHEFSGGMRQRVVIALALAGRPRLIVADEPTTALDVSVQAQIVELLRDLSRETGMSVMLVTHDMGVIAAVADRVAVVYAGRVVETGPVADVLRAPLHPYTRGLMDSIPVIGRSRGRLRQIPGAMPRPGAVPEGCAFRPRCPQAADVCARDLPPERGTARHHADCWMAPGGPGA
jgi:peptide/nickel transport system ATP-binding protein